MFLYIPNYLHQIKCLNYLEIDYVICLIQNHCKCWISSIAHYQLEGMSIQNECIMINFVLALTSWIHHSKIFTEDIMAQIVKTKCRWSFGGLMPCSQRATVIFVPFLLPNLLKPCKQVPTNAKIGNNFEMTNWIIRCAKRWESISIFFLKKAVKLNKREPSFQN